MKKHTSHRGDLRCDRARGAANDTFLIRNADVYPVTGAPMKGVSMLVQDGKIADIGAKIVPPKGIRIVEGKGLRVYPGMIDSNTSIGLSEVSSERDDGGYGRAGASSCRSFARWSR